MMRISAVVPTLNAAATLGRCLQALAEADEIIVSDGGSTDRTLAVAEAAGARVLTGPAGRGGQLARGAQAARHEALLFVHGDTVLASGAFQSARVHLERSSRPACFSLSLDDPAWQARVLERAVSLRTRLFRLPYGDQGLILRREHYLRAGGFRLLPLMEDVDLVGRLGPITLLPDAALTSAERWRRDGWFRRSARNLLCFALWRAGVSPQRVARLYGIPRPASPPIQDPAPRAE